MEWEELPPPPGCEPRGQYDPCQYAVSGGQCEYKRLDYLAFHYCTVRQHWGAPGWATAVLLVPWLVLLFGAVGATADAFFAPAVAAMADHLKLSGDVAGE
jgi:hypothetical protein